MTDSTAKTLLWVAAGGGAVFAYSRWRKKRPAGDRDDQWGKEHDEDPVEPKYEAGAAPPAPSVASSPIPAREQEPTPSKALSRVYDRCFAMFGSGIPVPFLRALAARESGLNPNDPKGLINVVRVVREDFNARTGANVAPKDLTNPITNVTIAGDTLHRIIESYAKNHRDVPNLREDWTNRHFVELLTFSWNAGPSESTGLGRVVRYLKEKGQTDITLDDIVKNAYAAGAKHWLWDRKKARWTRSVAELYVAELERDVVAGRLEAPIAPTVSSAAPAAASFSSTDVDAFDFGRPVPPDVKAIVTSGWSRPRGERIHRALDISVPEGTPVWSIDDGVVTHVRPTAGSSDAGIWVAVKHPSSVTSRYLHLSKARVNVGDIVQRGDVLGLSGDTGHSSGPHLHLDLRVPPGMLGAIAHAIGKPRGGWGAELKPYGYSVPGEPWVPVDGYRDVVARDAARAGIPLHAPVAPAPTVASAEPVSNPNQVDHPAPTVASTGPVSSPDQVDEPIGG